MSKDIFFSIIIPTIGRPEKLRVCLESIVHQTVLPKELILVDISGEKTSYEIALKLLAETGIDFIYITPDKKGSAYQRNVGAKKATGEVLFFTDDDVALDPKYLEVIQAIYQRDKGIAGVTGYIVNSGINGFFGLWFRKFFMLSHNGGKSRLQLSGYSGWDFRPTKELEVDIMSGADFSVKKDVFDQYQFCELFGGYSLMEDVELSYRIAQKYRLVQTPEARLYHYESEMAKNKVREFQEQRVKNHYYLFKNNIKQTPIRIFCYYWSEFGGLLLALGYILKYRNLEALRGVRDGWKARKI